MARPFPARNPASSLSCSQVSVPATNLVLACGGRSYSFGTTIWPPPLIQLRAMEEIRNLIIIGGGPAGYTAALYAARANLQPLVIEGFQWGGQLMITSDVENYPGFVDAVLGPELMATFRAQAERFGAEFVTDDVTKVDFSEQPLRVWSGDEEYLAQTVIIATGAEARKL